MQYIRVIGKRDSHCIACLILVVFAERVALRYIRHERQSSIVYHIDKQVSGQICIH